MVVTNVFPANNAVEVCADTKLWITFATTPIMATSGNLQICKVSDDSVVWQLDLQVLPTDPYGYISTGWPTAYRINLNGLTLNYTPFTIIGRTVEILPAVRLEYNTAYYVKMTSGFCTDANGNTSPAIIDNTTWRFTTKASAPAADHDYTVALDDSGDFCTMQGAVDAVADNDSTRTIIKIKKGTYRGVVYIPPAKKNITWLGEDKDTTIISAFNRETFNPYIDIVKRMVVGADADGFRMYNLTLQNTTPDGGTQGETITHSGQTCIAENCNFKSYQNTVLSQGQEYFKNCYIEGDTDYICGYGNAYFDKCELKFLTASSPYQTAAGTLNGTNGFFFVDCNLTGAPGVSNCWYGRFFAGYGYEYSQSAYINCIMPKTLIRALGWKQNGVDTTYIRLWEYKSVEPNGTLIDVSGRMNPGSKQLDDANAIYWREVNNVFSHNPWNPKEVNEPPTAAWQPYPADQATGVLAGGTSLTWGAGAGATSHLVYFGTTNPPDPNSATEQTGTSFATGAMTADVNYYWRVDEKNSAGTTTGQIWSFTTVRFNCPDPIISDFNGDCLVNFLDYATLADAWIGDTQNINDLAQFASDWLKCNREPAGECWK
jgi:pectin methylesterase-like acyl-CoA thioesterase